MAVSQARRAAYEIVLRVFQDEAYADRVLRTAVAGLDALERAVAFTNAVMRRLTEQIRPLIDALPEGPLKLSYPDWIADVWTRDFDSDTALALMRAQNEPPETVVRLVRGDPPGEPTEIPGAYRVERVDETALAEGRIFPQSRASQLAGLVVGSRDGERVLDATAAPGAKATQLRGEVVAVELHEGRARELEENARLLGATNVRVVNADAREPPPELQLELLRAAAARVRPGGTVVFSVCTMNADENEAVVDASGLDVEPL